ncbi:MAG: pyridoxal-phosphate dependent enzyme [Thermoplasmatota archaeon]
MKESPTIQMVGRTPIIRAEKLEKELDAGKIFLKLEGNNPSGHREDRLAYLIIRDALSRGKKTICLGTYGTVGGSLSHLSQHFDVKCVFFVPNRSKALRKDLLLGSDHVKIIEHGGTFEDCVLESRKVARRNGWYDANPGLANNMMNMYAFSYIAKEIHDQLQGSQYDIFCQTSGGSSISGLQMGYKQLWIDEDIEVIPRINAVSTSHGNAIVESFRKGSRSIVTLEPDAVHESKLNRNVVNWECFNGQDALNAIFDTGSRAIGISDEELTMYSKWFRKVERIRYTPSNFFPLAALIKEAENGTIEKGNHVVILNDGRVDIQLRPLKQNKLGMGYDDFLKLLDTWLVQFSDPLEEIREATDNAFQKGYVIGAFDRGSLVGVAVVSRSSWETFFPHYHLSYIATKKNLRGMGIATQLIKEAIDLSEGSLSLHVETNNSRAIKLYEKMGLKKKYYRMLYHPPER